MFFTYFNDCFISIKQCLELDFWNDAYHTFVAVRDSTIDLPFIVRVTRVSEALPYEKNTAIVCQTIIKPIFLL